ncbi:MAG TPA: TAXI family TRAP transporter solute-binding subunit [Clostridia bacterium]|nr:TAXI family TRAP transporter solute-binding subunit [Clostridia bacterium]
MKKLPVLLLVFGLCFALVLAGCGGQQNAQQQEPQGSGGEATEQPVNWGRFSIGSSSIGSSSYTKTVAWANYMAEKIPTFSPIIESTAGSVANVQLLESGEVQIAQTMTTIAAEGWNGEGWAEGKKHQRMRAIATLDPFALQFYCLEGKGIQSIEDINGKHVNLSKAGSGTDNWARRLFDELGIKPAKISNVNPGEANDLMRDGLLDVAGVMGSVHPSIVEMSVNNELRIFGVSGEAAAQFSAKYPELYQLTIPAGSYKGIDYAIETLGEYDVLIVDKDLPEELVYELVKHTYQGKDVMAAAYEGMSSITPESIVLAQIPLHKGAYKYYQELGIEIPDQIKPID